MNCQNTECESNHSAPPSGSVFRVGYYACTAKAERNAEFPIHVVFAFDKDWPESVLRQRGLLGNRRIDRAPTSDEVKQRNSMARAFSLKYRSLDELIEDEQNCGSDEHWVEQLRSAFTPNATNEPPRLGKDLE